MIEHHTAAQFSVEDLQWRCEAAQSTFLTGVAHRLCLEEAARAHQAGEEPSEARVQERLREMAARVKEVQP